MLETDFQTFLSMIHHDACPENIFLDLRSYSNRPSLSETNFKQLLTVLTSEHIRQGIAINLRGNQLGDDNIAALAAMLQSGFAPQNLKLDLRMNAITSIGAKHLAAALKSGHAPQGLELNLASNYIGDVGMRAFADALASGHAPADLALNLGFNDIGDDGTIALIEALKSGKTPKGLQLNIRHNKLSKADIDAFIEGFVSSKIDPTIKLALNSEDFTPTDIEAARVFGLVMRNLYQKEISFDDVIKDKHKKPDILYAAVKLACQLNNLPVLDYLITHGAATDSPGDKTPLSIACEKGYFNIVLYLIDNDAFINAIDECGWSPSDYARENGHTQIVEYLETFKNTNLLKPITPPYQLFKYSAIDKLIDEIIKKSKEGAEEVEAFLKQYPDLYFYCKLYNPQIYDGVRKEIENNLSKMQLSLEKNKKQKTELPQEQVQVQVQETISEEPIALTDNKKPAATAPEEPPMKTYNVRLTPILNEPLPKYSLDEAQEPITWATPRQQNEPIYSSKDNTKKNKITAFALTLVSCLFVITIPFAGMIYRKIYQHLSVRDTKPTKTKQSLTSEEATDTTPRDTRAINKSLSNAKQESLPKYESLPRSYFKKPKPPPLASWPKTFLVYLYILFGPDPYPEVAKKYSGNGVKRRRLP